MVRGVRPDGRHGRRGDGHGVHVVEGDQPRDVRRGSVATQIFQEFVDALLWRVAVGLHRARCVEDEHRKGLGAGDGGLERELEHDEKLRVGCANSNVIDCHIFTKSSIKKPA